MFDLRPIAKKHGLTVEPAIELELACLTIADQANNLTTEMTEWIETLNQAQGRELYRICRQKNVMPEPVLCLIDKMVDKEEKKYLVEQKRKERPALSWEEKIDKARGKDLEDARFYLETKEKCDSGLSQRKATNDDETEERRYRELKRKWKHIETDDPWELLPKIK